MSQLRFDRAETKDLVSIVISAYRAEQFIGEALDSISAQTYENWELIVVEDGSRDGTEWIVREFARRHKRHRVDFSRSPRNLGLGYTRNLTFAKARGEFVAILDADDRWLPGFLDAAVDAAKSTGKDVVFSSSVMIEDQSNMLLGVWGPNHVDLHDFPQSLYNRNFITPSAVVIRRQTLADVGPWDVFEYAEDYSYWMRCLAAGKRLHHVAGCHCLYRKNHAAAMTQRMCGMMEGVAVVADRYKDTPGMRPKTCRKFASNAYAWAAHLHATTDPSHDPSADSKRAPALMMRAWRLRPKRLKFLLRALKMSVIERFTRRRSLPIPRPAAAAPAARAAA
jgi:glycosyltransferase involved in cell wall biosynthesis